MLTAVLVATFMASVILGLLLAPALIDLHEWITVPGDHRRPASQFTICEDTWRRLRFGLHGYIHLTHSRTPACTPTTHPKSDGGCGPDAATWNSTAASTPCPTRSPYDDASRFSPSSSSPWS